MMAALPIGSGILRYDFPFVKVPSPGWMPQTARPGRRHHNPDGAPSIVDAVENVEAELAQHHDENTFTYRDEDPLEV